LEKRSISISGHRTSLALEPEFWSALGEMAIHRNTTVKALVIEIDSARGNDNLASACRLAALNHYRKCSIAP
jgi:predicted DNA-binding ribbon-helix-helix protein